MERLNEAIPADEREFHEALALKALGEQKNMKQSGERRMRGALASFLAGIKARLRQLARDGLTAVLPVLPSKT